MTDTEKLTGLKARLRTLVHAAHKAGALLPHKDYAIVEDRGGGYCIVHMSGFFISDHVADDLRNLSLDDLEAAIVAAETRRAERKLPVRLGNT